MYCIVHVNSYLFIYLRIRYLQMTEVHLKIIIKTTRVCTPSTLVTNRQHIT